MLVTKTASLIFLVLLCSFLFPEAQGWWAARRRRRRYNHRHAWQKGRTKSTTYNGWHTSFDSSFNKKCSLQESLWNIQSAHEYYHEDRVWAFYCQSDYKISSKCSYKSPGNVNSLDGTFSYVCPRNGHVAGMYAAEFNGHFKDREFNFYCCDGNRPRANCKWTSYRNRMDGKLNYKVPYNYYLAGVGSYHNNRYEDRKWRFYICR